MAVIVGTGRHLPAAVLDNAEAARLAGVGEDWIVRRTGIRERRVAGPEEGTAALATRAAARALASAGVTGAELDLIIVATSTPDHLTPPTACEVQPALAAFGAACFDVEAGFAGWLYALLLADALIAARRALLALVIGAEKLSTVADRTDPSTGPLFGDGAGAVVLAAEDAAGRAGWASGPGDGDGSVEAGWPGEASGPGEADRPGEASGQVEAREPDEAGGLGLAGVPGVTSGPAEAGGPARAGGRRWYNLVPSGAEREVDRAGGELAEPGEPPIAPAASSRVGRRVPPLRLLSATWWADGRLAPALLRPGGGARRPFDERVLAERGHLLRMEGTRLFRPAVRTMAAEAERALERAGIGKDDVALVIPHQANLRIIEAFGRELGVPLERIYVNIDRYGNTGAATVPIALDEAREAGLIAEGDRILLVSFGAGATAGAAVLG
ncbi:MAG TPA: 3-oxoacyl-[acyl-carrier-protein] synthase III C-terminal domain-containing protein [Longimicrobiales bacterium]